tara:strand:+ start:1276 stop:2217 length:942 start_codon:yes stop_codon:yes gene_type:complete
MTDSYVVFVRHGEKLLLMKRASEDFLGQWDGIFDYGDGHDQDAVIKRVSDSTGISSDDLTFVRAAENARYIEIGSRLSDITPVLVVSETDSVIPSTIYDEHIWVDPGDIAWESREKHNSRILCYTNSNVDGSERWLIEMYGDVGSSLYIVKTAIGSEKKVSQEMHARMSGTGSLQSSIGEIFSVLHPTQMRGYVFVEASAKHHVEKLIGRVGGKDRSSRGVVNTTPLKNAKGVLGDEVPLQDVLPYLEPKSATSGIEIGCLVEIVSGAFKGEKARILAVADTKEEISMELYEADIPMTLNMRADHVRVIERIE